MDERAEVAALAAEVQAVTGGTVELAYVDQGDSGDAVGTDAAAQGVAVDVVKLPEAKRGFVLLPRRWVVERSTSRTRRFRRLAKDYERLPVRRRDPPVDIGERAPSPPVRRLRPRRPRRAAHAPHP